MLSWVKNNRIKVTSLLCIIADGLMGAAGAAGLYNLGVSPGDVLLTIAGVFGLAGHSINVLWGKGGAGVQRRGAEVVAEVSIMVRPLFPWRYPLDASFAIFILGSLFFVASGFSSGAVSLLLFGGITLVSSTLGWLWPQEKDIFGLHVIQVCSILYTTSGATCLISGILSQKPLIALAGACYLSANFILYTVRKENQSQYTIDLRGR